MPTIITPNPMKDVVVGMEIRKLDSNIYTELSKYKGQQPTKQQLLQSELYLRKAINDSLYSIGFYSLQQGAKEVQAKIPIELILALRHDAAIRADFSANSIINTTATAFGVMYAALSKKGATGKKRSKTVAQFEGPRIFFEQRTKAWRLKHGVRKAWYVQSDNCCANCEDNEDEGPISVTEEFPSGDNAPPAHINCECLMSLIM